VIITNLKERREEEEEDEEGMALLHFSIFQIS